MNLSEALNLLNSQLKYLCISREIWNFHTPCVWLQKDEFYQNPLGKYLTHGLRTAEEQMQLATKSQWTKKNKKGWFDVE